jgi:hypothetical protein
MSDAPPTDNARRADGRNVEKAGASESGDGAALAALLAVVSFAIPAATANYMHIAGRLAAARELTQQAIGLCIFIVALFLTLILAGITFARAYRGRTKGAVAAAFVLVLGVAAGAYVEAWAGYREEMDKPKSAVATPPAVPSVSSPTQAMTVAPFISVVINNAPSTTNVFAASRPSSSSHSKTVTRRKPSTPKHDCPCSETPVSAPGTGHRPGQ